MSVILLLALAVIVLIVVGGAIIGIAFQLLWWALIGLVIGALARIFVSGTEGLGLLATSVFGVAGALIGGVVARGLGVGSILQFVIAVLVAAALIALFGDRARREAV